MKCRDSLAIARRIATTLATDPDQILETFISFQETDHPAWESLVEQRLRERGVDRPNSDDFEAAVNAQPNDLAKALVAHNDAETGERVASEEAAFLLGFSYGLALRERTTARRGAR